MVFLLSLPAKNGSFIYLNMSVEKKKGRWFFLKNRSVKFRKVDNEDNSEYDRLYRKADDYMYTAQPYLCEDFSLTDLAEVIYTNKTYLSRSINRGAHKSFPLYLNGFRIEHAIALMDENPHLTVKEVALKSGFRNTVSFNDAFKKERGMTPGAYLKKKREEENR